MRILVSMLSRYDSRVVAESYKWRNIKSSHITPTSKKILGIQFEFSFLPNCSFCSFYRLPGKIKISHFPTKIKITQFSTKKEARRKNKKSATYHLRRFYTFIANSFLAPSLYANFHHFQSARIVRSFVFQIK